MIIAVTAAASGEDRHERVSGLGVLVGEVIAGIYAGIRRGAADNPSQIARAAGREYWDSAAPRAG